MMKKNLLMIALVSSTVAPLIADTVQKPLQPIKKDLANLAPDNSLNICFVDSISIMRGCKHGAEAGKKLEAMREKLTNEIKEEEQKITKAMTDFQNKAATLSDAAREKEEKNLRKMKTEYEANVQEKKYEMELEVQKITEELANEMQKAVTVYAQENKLSAVADTITGRVLYVEANLNITDDVLKAMNKEQKIAKNDHAKPDLKGAVRN